MRQIGHIVGREDFGLFLPDEGDRVVLADDGGGLTLSVYSGARCSHWTDKVNYPSLGGVSFFGADDMVSKRVAKAGKAAFVASPHWVAANILAFRRMEAEAERREETGEEWKSSAIELRPVHGLDDAIDVIRGEVVGYQWMSRFGAWGVPGYEFGPERWVLFSNPASLG